MAFLFRPLGLVDSGAADVKQSARHAKMSVSITRLERRCLVRQNLDLIIPNLFFRH